MTTANEIHLWVRSASAMPDEVDTLSGFEKTRAAAIASSSKRAQFVAGRALLRHVLGDRLGLDAANVPLTRTERGKPTLATDISLDFNVSHSDDVVVVALAQNTRIAVDVETMRPTRACDRIALRCFSSDEHAMLAATPEAERLRVFHEIWTCKEAYLKAMGQGIFSRMSFVTVLPEEHRVARGVAEDDRPERWRLETLELSPAHRASVCWDMGGANESWKLELHDERSTWQR